MYIGPNTDIKYSLNIILSEVVFESTPGEPDCDLNVASFRSLGHPDNGTGSE